MADKLTSLVIQKAEQAMSTMKTEFNSIRKIS